MPDLERRAVLQGLLGLGSLAYTGLSGSVTGPASLQRAHVVVVGAGFGGSTCARYLKLLAPRIQVTLIEPLQTYYTCPLSNLVLAGLRQLPDLALHYRPLRDLGIRIVHASAQAIDFEHRQVHLAKQQRIAFDRLVVAPGVDFKWNSPEGYDAAASQFLPHAWKAGPQTARLREQLRLLRNGGVVAISIPPAPFRCPPGPYERASLIAYYLKHHKPRCKILILDANEKFSKQVLFEEAWASRYPGMIERLPITADGAVRRVAAKSLTLFTELDKHRVAVANVIPPQYAGAVARNNGLTDSSGWCPIDARSFASRLRPNTYVLGDACSAEPMPKSATSANSQAKTCALGIIADLAGTAAPAGVLHNTCYSLIAPDYGISINAMYRSAEQAIVPVSGAGGISPLGADAQFRQREAAYTLGWYHSIRRDSFGV